MSTVKNVCPHKLELCTTVVCAKCFKDVEMDRDKLKAELDEFKSKWFESNRNLHDAWKDRDACQAKLEQHDRDHVRIESELVIERNEWKAKAKHWKHEADLRSQKAERLAEALRQIKEKCGGFDGYLFMIADKALKDLAELEGTK